VPEELFKDEAGEMSGRTRRSSPETRRCSFCFGTGFEQLPPRQTEHGNVYGGVKRCRCRSLGLYREVLKRIPAKFKRYGYPRLERLKARSAAHPRQAQIIDAIARAPMDSYLFTGDHGTGKSHLAWALALNAFRQGRKFVECTLDQLFAQYRRWETQSQDKYGKVDKPLVIDEDLGRRDQLWTIYLDEVDAVSATEFACRKFFALLNAAEENNHQLLLTSNVSHRELQEIWSRVDVMWGRKIGKRMASCTRIEMFLCEECGSALTASSEGARCTNRECGTRRS
jgi:hypothetical protein